MVMQKAKKAAKFLIPRISLIPKDKSFNFKRDLHHRLQTSRRSRLLSAAEMIVNPHV